MAAKIIKRSFFLDVLLYWTTDVFVNLIILINNHLYYKLSIENLPKHLSVVSNLYYDGDDETTTYTVRASYLVSDKIYIYMLFI